MIQRDLTNNTMVRVFVHSYFYHFRALVESSVEFANSTPVPKEVKYLRGKSQSWDTVKTWQKHKKFKKEIYTKILSIYLLTRN